MLLSVVQALSRAGAWIAVVARPDLGLLAAQQRGVALERLVLIPEVGRHAAAVIAALIDGVDVVVTGHGVVLTGAQRRAVQARLRERDGLLLSESPWHGAAVTVTAERPRWHGLNSGDGLLRTVELDITVSGRRVPRTVHIAGVDPWAPVRAAGELPQRDPRNSPVPAAAMAAGSDGVMQELMVG